MIRRSTGATLLAIALSLATVTSSLAASISPVASPYDAGYAARWYSSSGAPANGADEVRASFVLPRLLYSDTCLTGLVFPRVVLGDDRVGLGVGIWGAYGSYYSPELFWQRSSIQYGSRRGTLTLRPGDRVRMRVAYDRPTSMATFQVSNLTMGTAWTVREYFEPGFYNGRSALVAMSTRDPDRRVHGLANFGNVSFTDVLVRRLDGTLWAIGSQSRLDRYTMVGSRTNAPSVTIAAPGSLYSDLKSFVVTRKLCG